MIICWMNKYSKLIRSPVIFFPNWFPLLPSSHLTGHLIYHHRFFDVSVIFVDSAFWTNDSYNTGTHSIWETVAIKKCSLSNRAGNLVIVRRIVKADKQAPGSISTLIVRHLSCFSIGSLWPSFLHFHFCYTGLEAYLGLRTRVMFKVFNNC